MIASDLFPIFSSEGQKQNINFSREDVDTGEIECQLFAFCLALDAALVSRETRESPHTALFY